MVLENKIGIINAAKLARVEEKRSKRKTLEMFETGFLNSLEVGTYKALSKIRDYLFGEIYEFAGKVRDVNIIKDNFCFAPVIYLEVALQNIEKMPQSTFDEIIENMLRWISLILLEKAMEEVWEYGLRIYWKRN